MKKPIVPKLVASKFKRAQFKKNEYVIIRWLGEYFYGYVKRTEIIGGTLSYWVETLNGPYPVGLKFKGFQNSKWGNIYFEPTKALGSDEIKKRYGRREKPNTSTISKQQRAGTRKVASDANDVTPVSGNTINDVHPPNKASSRKTKSGQRTSRKVVDTPKPTNRGRKAKKG